MKKKIEKEFNHEWDDILTDKEIYLLNKGIKTSVVTKQLQNKKSKRKSIIIGIILTILAVAIFGLINSVFAKSDDEAIKNCVANGKGQTYCERTVLGVY